MSDIDPYQNHELIQEVLRVWREEGLTKVLAHRINILASQYKAPLFRFYLIVHWTRARSTLLELETVYVGTTKVDMLKARVKLMQNLERLNLNLTQIPYASDEKFFRFGADFVQYKMDVRYE